MHRVKVALHTADPLSMVGLAGLLEGNEKIEVLPADQPANADVSRVAAERGPADVARRCAMVVAPVVLVTDDFDETELAAAVECGVVVFLPKVGLTVSRLVSIVIAAATTEPTAQHGIPRPCAESAVVLTCAARKVIVAAEQRNAPAESMPGWSYPCCTR